MDRVKLYVPTERELDYRRRLIADEETMSYNAGYGENGAGCYYQSREQALAWYRNWNNAPGNFYAYIVLTEDNRPIGEASVHWSEPDQKYMVGLVLKSSYRGKGYGSEALALLAQKAFDQWKLDSLYDAFPAGREAAERTFRKAGFERVDQSPMRLTRDRYEQKRKNRGDG